MSNKEIEKIFAKKLMEKMNSVFSLLQSEQIYDDNKEAFELIKSISSLTCEIMKDDKMSEKIKQIAKSSEFNGENIDDKFDAFTMIRNVVYHFPIFDSWDEIYISNNLLMWNKPKYSEIKKFFSVDRYFEYKIFIKINGTWTLKNVIKININKMANNKKFFLKDIISLEDALWTFAVVDYYLQFMGFDIEPRFYISV